MLKILNKDLANISNSNKLSLLKKKKQPKKYKKVLYEEELDSEPELVKEDYVAEETEESEIKKKHKRFKNKKITFSII